MYIIKSTTGDTVKIDYDELALISKAKPDTLILFRRGGMLRRMIGLILEDPDAEKEMMRQPGESREKVLERLRERKSEDIFEHVRTNIPALSHGDTKRLST